VAGRYDEAIEQCQKALDIDPGFPVALWVLALTAIEQGRYEEAVAAAAKGVDLSQRSTFLVSTLGCALARAGQRKDAEAALNELRDRGSRGYVAPFHCAVIHACLGEPDRAMDDLERAYADRTPNLVTIATLPILRDLRNNPRGAAIRESMGLP
jgi:tetratricopeptide (TPR) repeat protein